MGAPLGCSLRLASSIIMIGVSRRSVHLLIAHVLSQAKRLKIGIQNRSGLPTAHQDKCKSRFNYELYLEWAMPRRPRTQKPLRTCNENFAVRAASKFELIMQLRLSQASKRLMTHLNRQPSRESVAWSPNLVCGTYLRDSNSRTNRSESKQFRGAIRSNLEATGFERFETRCETTCER